jgi:hypothetical protein
MGLLGHEAEFLQRHVQEVIRVQPQGGDRPQIVADAVECRLQDGGRNLIDTDGEHSAMSHPGRRVVAAVNDGVLLAEHIPDSGIRLLLLTHGAGRQLGLNRRPNYDSMRTTL